MPAKSKPANASLPTWAQDVAVIGTSDDRSFIDTARSLSPREVNSILENASSGDPVWVTHLHGIMVRTWPRLGNCLQQVRDAATESPWQTTGFAEADGEISPEAKRRQDVVDAALFRMRPVPGSLECDLKTWLANAAEGIFYGPTAYELIWEMRDSPAGKIAGIRAVRTVPPQYSRWQQTPGVADALLYRPQGNRGGGYGDAWPENQFVLQMTGGRDHPTLGATLDRLVLWWVASVFSLKWQMKYAEHYGIPFMYANYPAGSQSDRDAAFSALSRLSGSRYAAFPQGTEIHIAQANGNAGDLPQTVLCEMADRICSETILGTALTTTQGDSGSLALGKVHKDGQSRRERAILNQVAALVETQVIPAILRVNFGNDDLAPGFFHGIEDEEDRLQTVDLLTKAKALGLAIPRAYAYEVLSIPMPTEGELLVGDGEMETETEPGAETSPEDQAEDTQEGETPDTEEEDQAKTAKAAAVSAGAIEIADEFNSDLTEILTKVLEQAAAKGANMEDDEL